MRVDALARRVRKLSEQGSLEARLVLITVDSNTLYRPGKKPKAIGKKKLRKLQKKEGTERIIIFDCQSLDADALLIIPAAMGLLS